MSKKNVLRRRVQQNSRINYILHNSAIREKGERAACHSSWWFFIGCDGSSAWEKFRWKEDLHDVHTISDYAACFCCVWDDSIACRFADLPIPGCKCSHLIPCCRLSTSDYFFSIESWRGPNLKTLFPFCFCANLTIFQFAFISSFERAQRKKDSLCTLYGSLWQVNECMGIAFQGRQQSQDKFNVFSSALQLQKIDHQPRCRQQSGGELKFDGQGIICIMMFLLINYRGL